MPLIRPSKKRDTFLRKFVALVIVGVAAAAGLYLILGNRTSENAEPMLAPAALSSSGPQSSASLVAPSAPTLESTGSPGAVAGTVRWADTAAPVGGISVIAQGEAVPVLEMVSDSRGAFLFDEIIAGVEYAVRAYGGPEGPFSAGERRVRVAASELLEGQDVTVWPGAMIGGRVLRVEPAIDIFWGAPLPGNGLDVLKGPRLREAEVPLPGVRLRLARIEVPAEQRDEIETVTDAEGKFEFPLRPAGAYYVEVEPPLGAVVYSADRQRNWAHVLAAPDRERVNRLAFKFRFDGLALEGRVIDDNGGPLAGVSVKAEPVAGLGEDGGGPTDVGAVETTTNAEGKYSLVGLAAGGILDTLRYAYSGQLPANATYTVTARAEGFAARQMVVPMLTAPMLAAIGELLREAVRQDPAARSSSNSASHPVARSHGRVIEVEDLKLEREATISGRISDTSGQTLAGVTLVPDRLPRPKLTALVPSPGVAEPVQTASGGQFRIVSVPAGTYGFYIQDAQRGIYESVLGAALRVKAGEVIENLSLVVPGEQDRGSVHGSVIDAQTRKPIATFQALIQHIEPLGEERGLLFGVQSNEGGGPGEFTIRRITPGRAELRITAEGYPAHWAVAEIRAGQQTNVLIELKSAARIEGRVISGGQPLQGAYLSVRRSDIEISNEIGGSSQADGAYRIEDLEAAGYLLTLNVELSPTMKRYERAALRLGPGETAHVDFQVLGDCRIEGTFNFPSNFSRGFVYLRDLRDIGPIVVDGDLAIGSQVRASARLEHSGPYVLEGLPPGDYSIIGVGIRPKSISNGTTMSVEPIPIETQVYVREGATARVDLTIP